MRFSYQSCLASCLGYHSAVRLMSTYAPSVLPILRRGRRRAPLLLPEYIVEVKCAQEPHRLVHSRWPLHRRYGETPHIAFARARTFEMYSS